MVCCLLDTMATTASIQTAEIESSETDRRDCSAISTPQPSSERPAVDDTRVLRKKERKALSAVLKSLDRKSLCSKVVAKVGSGLHFTCYPERKKFWDCICTSDALRALISTATDEFVRLYMAQTRGNSLTQPIEPSSEGFLAKHPCIVHWGMLGCGVLRLQSRRSVSETLDSAV